MKNTGTWNIYCQICKQLRGFAAKAEHSECNKQLTTAFKKHSRAKTDKNYQNESVISAISKE